MANSNTQGFGLTPSRIMGSTPATQGQGQYWLANQCNILSTMLLKGDTSKIDVIVKSEDHFWKTKKFM